MSGTAPTTRSPSIVMMSLSVVCVAGCWGPKLRVQRYSCSTAVPSSTRVDISTLFPRDPLEVMPFAAPPQRVVFAQRKTGEFVREQNATQVGMPFKDDPIHVEDFAFHPVGSLPQRDRRAHRQIGL